MPFFSDMPLMNGTSALIVGDYKLLLGHQVSKKSTLLVQDCNKSQKPQ
jgi:hypothetical protein